MCSNKVINVVWISDVLNCKSSVIVGRLTQERREGDELELNDLLHPVPTESEQVHRAPVKYLWPAVSQSPGIIHPFSLWTFKASLRGSTVVEPMAFRKLVQKRDTATLSS